MSVGASTDELQARVAARVSQMREALAALALVPAWTEQLAGKTKFPVSNLSEFLAEAEKRGLCVRGPIMEADTSMVRSARSLMLLWQFLDTAQRERWFARVLQR